MAATTVICKVVCIVADENSKRYRIFANKLEGKKIDVLEESDNIGKMLGVMLRSLREGRKMKYHHVLIILSENINAFVHAVGLTKCDLEVLLEKQKVTLVLDDVYAQGSPIKNVLDTKVETILMEREFSDLVDIILQSSYTCI